MDAHARPRSGSRSGTGESGQPASRRDLLQQIYRVALATRLVDERLWLMSRQGRVSFVITPRGHEVAQVASAAAVRVGLDTAWPYYRDMGVGLALGVSPYEIFLGGLGRADDPHSGARQLTAHLSSKALGIGTVSSAIAAQVPHAVGAAYAAIVLQTGSVAFCWMGEGAMSAGQTHEAMNLAAVHRFPVVFLIENNGHAISVPQALQMPIKSVAERAAGYAMPGVSVDGADPIAVYDATTGARDRAMRGEGPTLIELRVVRMTPHSSQDDDAYRTAAEKTAAVEKDPLPKLRAALIAACVMTEPGADELATALRERVLADEDLALSQPEPDASRARRWLYAGDEPHVFASPPSQPSWQGVVGG